MARFLECTELVTGKGVSIGINFDNVQTSNGRTIGSDGQQSHVCWREIRSFGAVAEDAQRPRQCDASLSRRTRAGACAARAEKRAAPGSY